MSEEEKISMKNKLTKLKTLAASGIMIGLALSGQAMEVREDGETRWICGEDGERIVGVGRMVRREKGWRVETAYTTTPERIEFTFAAKGGEGEPHGWMLDLPLAQGTIKEQKVHKLGRWQRFSADEMAEPMEHSLGKYKIFRSQHGNVLMKLSGNENWTNERRDHVSFAAETDGRWKGKATFFPMREGEAAYECAARVNGLPFALMATTDHRNNLYDAEATKLRVALTETAGVAREKTPLAIVIRDWDGKEVFARRGTTSLREHERKEVEIPIVLPGRGIYFVEVTLGGEFVRTTIAIIPQFEFHHRGESVIGLNMRCGRVFKSETEEEYRLAARLGMAYIRSGDNCIAKRYGMEAGMLAQIPRFDYIAGEEKSEAQIKEWLDAIAEKESPIFEFGNEIGHFADMPTRHQLYDRYSGWLDGIRAARAKRGMNFQLLYGTSAKRPELVKLIAEKGIFDRLDALVVHPGRLNWTSDLSGKGWRYLGIVRDSRLLYEAVGQKGKPIYLTETYTKTRPNNCHSDSLRQSAENAVLNVVLAMGEGCKRLCIYQLHEGVSYDENGIDLTDTEYSYGILNRDNSLKPSAIAYETAAEELDGAKFVRYIGKEGTQLKGCLFTTPKGTLAVLWDRTEGYDLRTEGPRKRTKGEKFFHFEPWLDNWRVKTPYSFASRGKAVMVRDAIGRAHTLPASGSVRLELTGAPIFVRGLDEDKLPNAAADVKIATPAIEEAEKDNRLY